MGARLAPARSTRVSAASSGRCWFLPAAAWGSAAGEVRSWGGPQPSGGPQLSEVRSRGDPLLVPPAPGKTPGGSRLVDT